MKYNLVLQRYQTCSLKSLPFSPKSTWWFHTAMPRLFPWPTSSGKAPWLDFALCLWRLGREPSGIPLAFTSIWARLAFLPEMGARNQGHYSWDEGNFNQRTSARGNGGMCDATLPPCGELPWRWMKKDGWLARCEAILCHKDMTLLYARVPLLWLDGPLHIAVISPPGGEAWEIHVRPGGPMRGQHQLIALVPGFADLIFKFCIDAANVKRESGLRSAFRG